MIRLGDAGGTSDQGVDVATGIDGSVWVAGQASASPTRTAASFWKLR